MDVNEIRRVFQEKHPAEFAVNEPMATAASSFGKIWVNAKRWPPEALMDTKFLLPAQGFLCTGSAEEPMLQIQV